MRNAECGLENSSCFINPHSEIRIPQWIRVMADERRRDERVPLLLDVRWEGVSGKYAARISDISLSGCYVESLGQVMVGEVVHFEIQLPTGRWMPLRGEVVYHLPTLGFGVQFAGLTLMERNLLAHVIDYARDNN